MPPRDIVSFSTEDHPALASALERALVEEKEKNIEALTLAKDWADFEKRRGRIEGINSAIGICQDVRKKIEA